MILTRRGFIAGLCAAPIIARAGILMPVRPVKTYEVRLIQAYDIAFDATRIRLDFKDEGKTWMIDAIHGPDVSPWLAKMRRAGLSPCDLSDAATPRAWRWVTAEKMARLLPAGVSFT